MTTDDVAEALSPADKAALERAIELYRAGGRTQRKTVETLLANRSWTGAARYCAFHLQVENLQIPPWQVAPCDARLADLDQPYGGRCGEREAAETLKKLLARGLSRYEADAGAALERAQQRQAAK